MAHRLLTYEWNAMSLPRKCETNSSLPASRHESRGSLGQVKQADRSNPSEIKPDVPPAARLAFAEDFTLEHSFPSLQIISIEFSGIY